MASHVAMSVRTRIRASQWQDGEAEVYVSLPQSDWSKWLPETPDPAMEFLRDSRPVASCGQPGAKAPCKAPPCA